MTTLEFKDMMEIHFRQLAQAMEMRKFLKNKIITPPWVAAQDNKRLVDSMMYCMMVPTQYRKDYTYDYPFHYYGSMKSHPKLVFVVVYIKYLFSYLNITRPYKKYYQRFSDNMCDLISPAIPKDSVESLQNRIIETAGLHESLFTYRTQQFIYHEPMDIVHNIPLFGVVFALMCFFGERVMGIIAPLIPDGGSNYTQVVHRRLTRKEDAYDANLANYKAGMSRWHDNNGRYSYKVLKLIGKCKPLILSNYFKSMLYMNVVEFITSQLIDDMAFKSRFVRIIFTYRGMTTPLQTDDENNIFRLDKTDLSLVDWLTLLHKEYTQNIDNFTAEHVSHLVHGICTLNYDTMTVEENRNMLNDNFITLHISDFDTIIREMVEFASVGKRSDNSEYRTPTYTRAYVKGVEVRGRGTLFAENKIKCVDYTGTIQAGTYTPVVTNDLNKLKYMWFQKKQIDSWCFVEDWAENTQRIVTKKLYAAHVNYFIRLNFPSDKLVTGLVFCNAVLRVPDFHGIRCQHYITTDDSHHFRNDKQFICANYIKSTSFSLSAVHYADARTCSDPKPMKFPKPVDKVIGWPLIISNEPAENLTRLYFIPLHPEREHVGYGLIETDPDGTKTFEKEPPVYYRHLRNDKTNMDDVVMEEEV